MAIYGAAYELTFNREAAGAAIHPNECRLYRSTGVWAGTTTLTQTLSRGYVPYPATGAAPNIRRVSGLSHTTTPSTVRFAGDARDNFGYVDGVLAASGAVDIIQRCGYSGFYGRGRAAPGDFLSVTGALLTAIEDGDTAATADLDCYAGPGYFDDPQANITASPWETGDMNGGMWTSHLGIYDFLDDAVDQNTRQDALYLNIINNGNRYTLPNGVAIDDCSYAGVSPEGTIWILPADYGTNVQTNVANNTADSLRNHPGVFVRRAGASYLRAVSRRWRDRFAISVVSSGQPVGIYQVADPTPDSKWLIVCDGVADIVYIQHPDGSDYRRPRDIWNNVIVPLIRGTGSNSTRVTVTDFWGNPIATETRWQFLSYARFLGPEGTTTQTNATPPG